MKYIFLALVFIATAVFAEPTFDQMQDLIAQKQYAAAEQGLEVIIKNHPTSAKAFYSMAQAQAGLGHLDKAQFALDKAKGLDPTLKFASQGNIESLQVAITPQVKNIEKIESGFSWLAAFFTALALGIVGFIAYLFFKKDKRNEPYAGHVPPRPIPEPLPPLSDPVVMQNALEAVFKDRPEYFAPKKKTTTKRTVKAAPRYDSVAPTTPVVENHYHNSSSSGSDMMTGVLLGSMINNHTETTRVVEREVIVERPSHNTYSAPEPTRSSSWENSPSRSSSWEDDNSKSSSSWSSSSSSSDSSSSWSSSDSSSSSSSSSWD